jgi:hypothetical protein
VVGEQKRAGNSPDQRACLLHPLPPGWGSAAFVPAEKPCNPGKPGTDLWGNSEPGDSTAPAWSGSLAPSARLSAGSRAAACLLQPLAPARVFRKGPCPAAPLGALSKSAHSAHQLRGGGPSALQNRSPVFPASRGVRCAFFASRRCSRSPPPCSPSLMLGKKHKFPVNGRSHSPSPPIQQPGG